MFSKKVMKNFNKVMVFIILALSLTGCYGKADYEAYKEALVKTDTIQRGRHAIEVTSDQTFSAQFMNSPDYNKLKGFESVKYKLSGQFDYTQEMAIYDLYVFYDNLGTDLSYYRLSQRDQYIKLPMFKDYLRLQGNRDDYNSENTSNMSDANPMGTLVEAMDEEWRKIIQKDNVFVGEKTTIKNEDGDVKATRFTIKPTTKDLRTITEKVKGILLEHQDELAGVLGNYSHNIGGNKGAITDPSESEAFDGEKLGQMIETIMDNMTISQFEEVAYVDLDGYIVEETITLTIKYNESDFPFESQKITIRTQNWDIEQAQKMAFPIIDETNSKPMETFDFKIQ